MNNVMIDLETLGTTPGSVILSIGAVAFDPVTLELGTKYYSIISTKSCLAHDLWVEEATAKWWDEQSAEAQKVLFEAQDGPDIVTVLEGFTEYLNVVGDPKTIRMWGNGSDFDNALLACAYTAIEKPLPWQFYNNRCYRTIKGLAPAIKINLGDGVHHNALDDAKAQAIHLMKISDDLGLAI